MKAQQLLAVDEARKKQKEPSNFSLLGLAVVSFSRISRPLIIIMYLLRLTEKIAKNEKNTAPVRASIRTTQSPLRHLSKHPSHIFQRKYMR